MAQILLVEDDPEDGAFIADAIATYSDLTMATYAGTRADGLAALEDGGVDAAVIDVLLPDGSGLDVVARAVELDVAALVMTTWGDEETIADAITRGASGYLMKEGDVTRVGDAIVRMLAGEAPLNGRVARYLLERLPGRELKGKPVDEGLLTPTEHQVLEVIARGYTHTECAEALTRSAQTIRTHIKNIYAKLSVGSRAEAVSRAVSKGLIDPDAIGNDAGGSSEP